jgi:hypothetical protein
MGNTSRNCIACGTTRNDFDQEGKRTATFQKIYRINYKVVHRLRIQDPLIPLTKYNGGVSEEEKLHFPLRYH